MSSTPGQLGFVDLTHRYDGLRQQGDQGEPLADYPLAPLSQDAGEEPVSLQASKGRPAAV